MSDHSLVTFKIEFNSPERGRGYFKLNNSFILHTEYQEAVRKVIQDTAELNQSANPNTLWEIIKGAIRNESIQYAAHKKKENNKREKQLIEEIGTIKNNLMIGSNKPRYWGPKKKIKKKKIKNDTDYTYMHICV